jgi:hypothetical protein
MIKFRDFVTEGFDFPVVSIDKDKTDLSKEATRNEINKNLAAELSIQFVNPYAGWIRIGKLLTFYNITLPKVLFDDDVEGEEVVAITQFGGVFGADLSGKVTAPHLPDESEFYLYYSYGIDDSGFYKAYAVVVDEEELSDMLEDSDEDEDLEVDPIEGELDPRQED